MKRKYKVDRVFEVNENDSVRDANDEFDSGYVWADVERFINYYGTEIKEPITYKVGDRFLNDCHRGEWRLVGLCDDGVGYGSVALVGESGFAYGNSVPVKNIDAVTQEEFAGLLGQRSHFTKIEDSE